MEKRKQMAEELRKFLKVTQSSYGIEPEDLEEVLPYMTEKNRSVLARYSRRVESVGQVPDPSRQFRCLSRFVYQDSVKEISGK